MGRRRRQKTPEADTSNLPYEIICIILSKLPAKSLMRFRCVCKLWRTLISEPHFVKSQFTEAVKSDRQRILCSLYSCDRCFSLDCESGVPGEFKQEELFFPIKKYRKSDVLSSCNGLIVLGLVGLIVERTLVVWNPSTNAYIKLPCPTTLAYIEVCGLCYDSLIDDYKMVFVTWDGTGKNYYVVYTCRSNSWTEGKEFNYRVHHHRIGVSVNGAPHWIMTLADSEGARLEILNRAAGMDPYPRECNQNLRPYKYDSDDTRAIIYFDSVDDNFKEVPPPYWMQKGYIFSLMVIREWLGLYISTSDHKVVEVWAMKEYGVIDSWTKLFSIPCEMRYARIRPLTVTKKDEVVVHCSYYNKGFKLYDPKENKWTNLKIPITNPCSFTEFHTFVDSLVLPTRKTLTKKQQHKRQRKGKEKEF